jgi:hypothetical protein
MSLPSVDIDPEGTFKYVLVKATKGGESKFIVTGYTDCAFHGRLRGLKERIACSSAGPAFSNTAFVLPSLRLLQPTFSKSTARLTRPRALMSL